MIHAERIWKSLGHRPVLRGVSLDVARGERIVLLGANGSGKSTLLGILAGVLEPDHGKVALGATSIGFAPENPDLPDHLTVGEWLDLIASLKRDTTPGPDLGVAPLFAKRTNALSLGQRQRVSLTSAWLGGPDVLVFDEPTNALDAATRERIVELLRASTCIVATHDRELAERIATRVLRVEDGQLVATS